MAITREEIREIASLFFQEDASERVNQCGRLASIMQMELEEHSAVTSEPVLQTGSITNNGNSTGHAFVTLAADSVVGATDGPVIIDASIPQFSQENYDDGLVALEVESAISMPKDVGVFTPDEVGYSLYVF